jgi:cellobiose dehydrogenase (acceptor)
LLFTFFLELYLLPCTFTDFNFHIPSTSWHIAYLAMRASLPLLALAAGASAQTSSAFTDANTGITFQGYEDTTGFRFGMALPSTIGSDFIGQMIVPTNGSGYGGVSLTGSMVGSLLVVAWPNAGSVVASLRETR